MTQAPLRICVTGAAGNLAYVLLPYLANGYIFGNEQPIQLFLLDIPPAMEVLRGIVMELEDCLLPLLRGIVASDIPRVCFENADVILLLGSTSRKTGQENPDLLENNASFFKEHGLMIDQYAKKTAKILVVGNPCNTNAVICMENAPSIPRKNFVSLTRLDYNRSKSYLASHLGVDPDRIRNIIFWGNHASPTSFPDISHAYVADYPTQNEKTPLVQLIKDENWIENEFVDLVRGRSRFLSEVRNTPPKISGAVAVIDQLKDWWQGTREGEFISMGVYSDGSVYGLCDGIFLSLPVTCSNGEYSIVSSLNLSPKLEKALMSSKDELLAEKARAMLILD